MLRRAPWFLLLSLAVFAVIACGDDDDGGGFASWFGDETAVPTEASTVATDDPTVSQAEPTQILVPGETPVATATPGDNGPPPTQVPPADPTAPSNATVVTCGDPLAVLDKQHRLPADCVPSGLTNLSSGYEWQEGQALTSEAATAFVEMLDDAIIDGHDLFATSSYRSYAAQESTYSWHVNTYGQAEADRVSARPGHSEHQLGTTVDITSADVGGELLKSFGDTPGGRWLADHAAAHGFVMSYPAGLEAVTGYDYEPWHFRYIGPSLAADYRASGLTLREFLLAR